MHWYAGTSGFSYKEWKGVFYPETLPNHDMLGYYAQRLPAVEINNTFYRMPHPTVLARWAAAVPDGFRFVVKAPRRITHQQRLQGTGEPVTHLAKALEALGDKLGAVLFQLPPDLACDCQRLDDFLDSLPRGLPAVFEFRHSSWNDRRVLDLLRDAGAARCVSEAQARNAGDDLATTRWIYLRLRKPGYDDGELLSWARRGRLSGVPTGYAFFKHEDEGAGPALAARFLRLADLPERRPPRAVGHRHRPGEAGTR